MKPKVKTWLKNIDSGKIKNNTESILMNIKCFPEELPATIFHLREMGGWPHQTVTAIVSNLMDEGLIKSIVEIEINGSFYSKLKYVHNEEERIKLIQRRKDEKLRLWIRRGLNEFNIPPSLKDYLGRYENYLTKKNI